jgi:hypothetical protein
MPVSRVQARVIRLACLIAVAAAALPATALGADDAGDPIIVISGPAVVEAGETVEAVIVGKGDARIDGTVDGDVFVFDGDVTLTGAVEGDLVTIAGTAFLRPGANVTGDVVFSDEAPVIAPAASVGGSVDDEGWDGPSGALGLIGAVALWLAMTISGLALGALLVLLLPRAADALIVQAESGLAVAFAIGIAVVIGLPAIAAIAAVTLVGVPLAVAMMLALLPLAAVAYVVTAWTLGRSLVKEPRSRVIAFLAGFAILRAIALIPLLGLIAWLVAVTIGLGLIFRAIAASREQRPREPAPAL